MVAAVLVLLVVAEFVVRAVVGAKVDDLARSTFGVSHVHTGIGARPALLDVLTGSLAEVRVRADGVTVCSLEDVRADATLHRVSVFGGGDGRAVASTDATIDVGTAALKQALVAQVPVAANAVISTDPAAGVLKLTLSSVVALVVVERPLLSGTRIEFTTVSATLNGRSVPPASVTALVGGSGVLQRDLAGLPLDLRPTRVAVTADGIRLQLHGGSAHLTGQRLPLTC